jgi:predicted ATPase/class 3 adenylate cyclase
MQPRLGASLRTLTRDEINCWGMEVLRLPARAEPVEHRKLTGDSLPSGFVTFLFTDIEGSTRLARTLGPVYRQVLADHRQLLRGCLRDSGGAELLTEGDSFFAVFADVGAALQACVSAQRALANHPWPASAARPRVRMGLHTGYAVAHGGEYASAEVHRAARIAAAAYGGQVLCSEATARAGAGWLRAGQEPAARVRLVNLGLHRLRGFDDRIRLHQIVADGLDRHFPRPRTVDDRPHNLPAALTRFVGRAADRVELAELLRENRLVTVWGTGGVGKTRLAVQVARDLTDRYPDGVWFTDLAAIDQPERVAAAVAEGLGLRAGSGQSAAGAVLEHLAGRHCLLLVDTCEQQRGAVGTLVSRLLACCPQLAVLATSREPLGVPGELVWKLSALGTAGSGPSDAVALLTDLSGAGGAGGGRPADLDRLARQLAGMPLALELAADRLRVLPAHLLAERLAAPGADPAAELAGRPGRGGRDPDGLLPARHSDLSANLDWSYRRLQPATARLLRWLSVWPGRVELSAVEWLAADWLAPADTLGAVAELVDTCLLEADLTDTTVSYRLLEPTRWQVRQLAAEAGDVAAARARYKAWHHRPWLPAPRPVSKTVPGGLARHAGDQPQILTWQGSPRGTP